MTQIYSSIDNYLNDDFLGAGDFLELPVDARAEAYGDLLREIRLALIAQMNKSNLSRSQLASKLNVSKSVITRIFNPEADIYLSTIFDIAWALNCICKLDIRENIIDILDCEITDSGGARRGLS
ncbi:MAG: helix-turn-helix transcriptional regulator, partial [Gluconobacter cerinus]